MSGTIPAKIITVTNPSLSLSFSLSSFFFSLLFLFPLLFLFLLLLHLLLLFLFFLLFSPPNTFSRTDQPTRRPTSRHLNVDLAQGKCTAVGSLPRPLHSLLPFSPSPPPQKNRERFVTGIFLARNLFFIRVFKIIQKKTPPGEITGVTILN